MNVILSIFFNVCNTYVYVDKIIYGCPIIYSGKGHLFNAKYRGCTL